MPRVLVVDDNEDNRDSLSRRLKRRGFDVVTAHDGEEAIQLVADMIPDLVLMDMNMPVLDGWEATRKIRQTKGLEKLPVIALTAYAITGDRDRALEAGCSDYHTKPIEFDRLIEQMERLLLSPP